MSLKLGTRYNVLQNNGNNGNKNNNGNIKENNNSNLNQFEELDKDYINNYIITNKEWFNDLNGGRIKIAFDYYVKVQILRIFFKIINFQINLYNIQYLTPKSFTLEYKTKKKNFFKNKIELNYQKLNLILKTYKKFKNFFNEDLQNIKFFIENLDLNQPKINTEFFESQNRFSESIQNKINKNQKIYYDNINIFLPQEKRQIGLLEWIFNTELSMLELIVNNRILKNKNIEKRNYNQNLENFAIYRNKNPSNYRTKRNSIEEIKFNDYNLFLEIKKHHLKSNKCAYQFEKRSQNNTFQLSPEFNDITFDAFFDSLGIEDFSFLKKIKNEYGNQEYYEKIYLCLKKLTNLYLVPVDEEDSKILRTSRDIILMGITSVLYYDNFKIEIEGNESGRGAFGIVKLKNNKAYKYENLRMIGKTKGEKEEIIRTRRPYIKQSYVAGMQFISYIIQKYLYNLHPHKKNISQKSFVPNINDICFDFNKGISEIKMNTAQNNNSKFKYSIDLKKILFDNNNKFYEKPNFKMFVLIVFKKICEIIIFYQKKCCFIHRDLNAGNFIINFNINQENNIDLENIEIKLIDFLLSSIIVNNENNKKSILIYIDYRPSRDFQISNPYINKEWELLDIKYLINAILIAYTVNEKLEFLRIFIKNFFYDTSENNYLDRLKILSKLKNLEKKNKNKICFEHIALNSYFYKNIFYKIFGEKFKYQLFNPYDFLDKLNTEITNLNRHRN